MLLSILVLVYTMSLLAGCGTVAVPGPIPICCIPQLKQTRNVCISGPLSITIMPPSIWLALFSLLSVMLTARASATPRSWDDPNERALLTRLYNECGGPAWLNQQNWLNESVSMCDWRGVMICRFSFKQGRPFWNVNILDLSRKNLRCPFPEFILNIPTLKCLILSNNGIFGNVPDVSIATLSNLQHLDLSHNRLNGSVPSGLLSLRNIETIDLSSNRFSGPAFPDVKWESAVVRNLLLDNNMLSGTIPSSLGRLASIRYLSLRNNRLNGSIPSVLGDLPDLRQLDLSQNALFGSIPNSFSSPNSSLAFINFSHNSLDGRIPRLCSLSLNFIDVSHNRLEGEFDLLSESFGPASIDVSHNILSGTISPYQFVPGTLNHTYFIDISGNSFPCPYPLFDTSILMRRSPCIPPWNIYWRYILIAIGVVSFISLLGALIHRYCCHTSSQSNEEPSNIVPRVVWWVSWAVFALFSAADFFGLWNIMVYVRQSFDNCARFNGQQVFTVRMPPFVYFSWFTYSEILSLDFMNNFAATNGPFDTFGKWCVFLEKLADLFDEAAGIMSVTANFTAFKEDIVSSFSSQCAAIAGCAYASASKSCILADANAVEFGGTAFAICLALAIAVTALLAAGELFRLFIVARSCRVGSVRWHARCADFIFSSTFAPLLRFGIGASRFESDIVLHQSTARDILWRIVHQAVLRSIPVVALNYYFLTQIAQTGLVWTNAVSLVNGVVSVPLLLMRAFLRFRAAMAAAKADRVSLEASLDSGRSGNADNGSESEDMWMGASGLVGDGDDQVEYRAFGDDASGTVPLSALVKSELRTKSAADIFEVQLVAIPRRYAIASVDQGEMNSPL
jgi:hypothetical protein